MIMVERHWCSHFWAVLSQPRCHLCCKTISSSAMEFGTLSVSDFSNSSPNPALFSNSVFVGSCDMSAETGRAFLGFIGVGDGAVESDRVTDGVSDEKERKFAKFQV